MKSGKTSHTDTIVAKLPKPGWQNFRNSTKIRVSRSIMIGDDVEIMITNVSGEVVKLGISAPRRVSVHRKEVYEAIKAENLSASKASTAQLSSLSQFLRSRQSGQNA